MRLESVAIRKCFVLRIVLVVEITDESLVATHHLEELLALLFLRLKEGTPHFASLFIVELSFTL